MDSMQVDEVGSGNVSSNQRNTVDRRSDLSFTEVELDRIVEMAWEDRTPFEAIESQFGLSEQQVIDLMRRELKPASWRMWRKRVQGRATKHAALSAVDDGRFKANQQRTITHNTISKRSK